jgi:acetyl esterase
MEAGVPTELHVVAGGIHAFDQAAADLAISTRVRESRYAALNTLLGHPLEGLPQAGSRWIDPEIATVVPALQAAVAPEATQHLEGLSEVDAGRRLLQEMLGGSSDPVRGEETLDIDDRHIPGPEGAPDVLVRVYRPKNATGPLGCLVDIHGGAFMMGSMPMDHPANVRYASELGIVVVSVEYRLAPEHPFPAGVEDCYAALVWTHAHAAELGVDTSRIAVGGGSAGGALAAAVSLMARDRGGPAICFQLLQIPVMDDALTTWSSRTFVDSPVFNRPAAERMWDAYLGVGYANRETSPYAAPARAADLTGLPPAYVQVAELDPLRDEGIAYAQRLMQAGVSVELHSFPGTFHGSGIAAHATVSKRAAQEMVDLLGLALAPKDQAAVA